MFNKSYQYNYALRKLSSDVHSMKAVNMCSVRDVSICELLMCKLSMCALQELSITRLCIRAADCGSVGLSMCTL